MRRSRAGGPSLAPLARRPAPRVPRLLDPQTADPVCFAIDLSVAEPAGAVDPRPRGPAAGHVGRQYLDQSVRRTATPHLHRRPLRQLRRQFVDPAFSDPDASLRLMRLTLQDADPTPPLAGFGGVVDA